MKNLIILLLLPFNIIYSPSGSSYYLVKVIDNEHIEVNARLELANEELHLPIMSTDKFPNGQSEFISEIKVTGEDGSEIEIVNSKNNGSYFTWTMEKATGTVNLNYRITLNHDEYDWPFGVEEVAYRTSEGFMIIGRYLFIIPTFNNEASYEVSFTVPDSWKVSAPWNDGSNTNRFRHVTGDQLRENVLFIGSHQEEKIRVGETTIRLVLAPTLKAHKEDVIQYLEPNMQKAIDLFGDAPRSTYLIVIQEGPVGGGAFNQSYSMTIEKPVNQASSVLWGHGMIHETLHLWNGRALTPSGQMEWFREGVTEYLSIRFQVETGMMLKKNVEKKLENAYRRYFLSTVLAPPISLQEAGDNKNQNKMKIYGLGTFFSFILDIEIRHANGNTSGLEEVIRLMYRDFAKTGRGYALEDVINYSGKVAGEDLRSLFDDYVTGLKEVDVSTHLSRAGLTLYRMYDETYLIPIDTPSPLALEIRETLLR